MALDNSLHVLGSAVNEFDSVSVDYLLFSFGFPFGILGACVYLSIV